MSRDTTTRLMRLACALLFFFSVVKSSPAWGQQADVEHAASDAYWAQKAQAYPAFEVDLASLRVAELDELNVLGQWGPVLDWPHIPVSAAHLPDGRILTWASNQEEGFPAGPEFTYAAAWDPIDGSFKMVPHTSHDMFCAHQVMLEDGRLLVMGGRHTNTVSLTSIFDPDTDTWAPQEAMDRGRWYPTAVAMPDGDVMVAVGSGGGSYPEVWNDDSGWRTLTNVNLNTPILNFTGFYENNWWPLFHVAPNGEVFHSGPTPDMHYINTGGTGSITRTGPQITGWYPKHGATVMYEEGRLLVAGGAISGSNQASTNRAMTIDITGGNPVMTEVASMAHARKFQNGVMLPTGEVLIIGGNTSGQKFSDNGTVLAAEMWNPQTQQWTTMADMSVPRNYHSVALLMTDGRVWAGGGGLCGSGCAANHVDAQVFSPPYLFNPDGTPATRPVIDTAPATVRNGAEMSVNATPGLTKFSIIKMSSTTHGVNSDVRFLSVPFTENGSGSYSLSVHENANVLTPGQWMLFGIDAAGVPSEAAIVHVSTEGVPQVTNPGTQVTPEGETVSLSIQATDDDPLSFSASGLPANLSIDSATGEISGTIAAGAAGTYDVEVTVTDAVGDVNIVFNWIVTTGATGTILREWWTGISGNEIGLLTDNSNYPDNPSGSDYLTSFEAPADWADNYGTRVRGYIHPPISGDYTFWISTDDFGELWLSSDDNSANATRIAHVPGWANDYDWYKFPEQQSASISLNAGQRYYVEVLQKEGGGLDNLAVAWQMPGGSLEIIAGGFLSPFSFNDPPMIAAVADQNGAEGEAVSLVVSASDPDGDVLTFSAAGLPVGVTIDPSTGLISGGFVAGSAGVASVTVTASDGEASASTNFDWTIDPARGSWIDYTDDSSIRLTITSVPQTDIDEKDVVVGDLDNDGWDDVVVVRKEGFMATGARADLLLMNEQGTLVDRTEAFAPGFAAAPTIARDAVIADFDGDGWDDLVIASTFGDQPRYYRNLGKNGGTWLGLANESAARLPALDVGSIQYCGVSVGDVNGDGAPDLYFANYVMDGATKDVLLINDGNGNFTDEGDDRLGELINSTFGVQATIIDIDKDGDQDIVKLSAKHATQPWGDDGIFILYNNGSGQFTDWSTVPSDLAYMFGIGDFDEDGRYDVYVVDDRADYVNRSTGVTANSNISFSQTVTPWARTAGNGGNLHMGDLDGDGDIDLGVADVDSSFPPCETEAGSLRSFVLLENKDDATGDFIDPFGAADKPWNVNMFDFAFMDINKDGNLDIFTAECSGYRVFTSTQDPVNPGEPTTLALGDLNLGVAAHDSRTGGGYIMYSEESVHERFAAAAPSAWAADHLVAVVFAGGQWTYDRNKDALVTFTPRPTDRLLAEIDFGANTVNLLEGVKHRDRRLACRIYQRRPGHHARNVGRFARCRRILGSGNVSRCCWSGKQQLAGTGSHRRSDELRRRVGNTEPVGIGC